MSKFISMELQFRWVNCSFGNCGWDCYLLNQIFWRISSSLHYCRLQYFIGL